MAVTYRASLRTTRMNSVLTDIDSGVGAATLEIGSAGFASTLVTIPLDDPAGSVTGDVLTISGLPNSAAASATGTAAEARIKEAGGTVIVSGLTVGTSGTNLIISPSTTITSGQTVNLNSLTITHATT